jgi:hypothetical protein
MSTLLENGVNWKAYTVWTWHTPGEEKASAKMADETLIKPLIKPSKDPFRDQFYRVKSVYLVHTRGEKDKMRDQLKALGASLLYFTWVKGSLYWLILSSGIVAEGAFLLASLWMSLNSSIHNFIRLFLPEDTTIHISEIATAAYVGLPECILFLASVIVINHVRVFWYDRKNKIALVWAVFYGLPTLVFLILSLFTLGESVLSVQFQRCQRKTKSGT